MLGGGISGGLTRRRRLPFNADINVTSLVDVAFVLLIIFMITAPMMQGGVDVDLPRARTAPITSKDGVIISIDRRGRIYVDDVVVSYDELRTTIRALVDRKRASSVYVRGDRSVPYGSVVRVLAALHQAGITSAGLVTEDEEITR